MIARKQELTLQLNQLADALVLAATLYLAYLLRASDIISFDVLPGIPPLPAFVWLFVTVMLFMPLLLEMQGFYQYPLEKSTRRSLAQIVSAGFWFGLVLAVCVIFFKLEIPSRSVFLLFIFLAPASLLLRERLFKKIYLDRLRAGQGLREEVIAAGSPRRIGDMLAGLTPTQRLEIHVVDQVDLETQPVTALVDAMHRHAVGRVLFAFSHEQFDRLQAAIEACETEGVEAWVSADFIRTSIARPTYESLGQNAMLVFRVTPDLSWALVAKGVIDRLGALVGITLLLPVFAAIAALIKITSPGPVIFRQTRAGQHGRPFTMYKFRSMRTDAEMLRQELMPYNQMSGPVFKLENDPRITPFGKWIRKTSLDELPQLFNVLFGQMSLVGPRPLPIYEVDNFELTAHRRRLSMKPGLTCLWQISGRNNVRNFDDWVKLDVSYIDNWSLWLDFVILLRTIPVVLFGTGAK